MKTLFKNYNCLKHFYLVILLFYSCSKPGDEPLYGGADIYYRLTEEQLKQTPYFTNTSFDTITFISNNNDTLIFKKNFTDTSWYPVRPYFNANYYELYQNITTQYTTIKGNGSFSITNSLRESNHPSQVLTINFNKYNFLLYPRYFDNPLFKEDYSINGIIYKDVVTLWNSSDTSAA
jgi:hypothetical protein